MNAQSDYAALVLRLTNGVWFLAHAWLKLAVFTPAGTVAFFQKIGLPGPLAYLVIAAEIAGGLALILGVWTRAVSAAMIAILLGAIVAAHAANGFFMQNNGWEFAGFWTLTLVAQMLLGGGAYALVRDRLPFFVEAPVAGRA